ncbi:DUF1772 domain-containing protein [Alginatibacterium sediminis]|uniref:DUF1772 domain-containing protein n=1 Tax=Alginatibacterium sediminis TaxID=2164068 RepID=A0A420EDJ4_9ALTE|nr:anthrone oxygenase family protein [Alginatibacterium sediminis]RKF18736.1 DUF1772 domain-containing protein [Alginatibacterium sediminis]
MNMELLLVIGLSVAALSIGLVAGIVFAFSAFIMRAFDRLPVQVAVASMNSINLVILKSAFMPLFLGSIVLALLLMLISSVHPNAHWIYWAGGFYLLGGIACTGLFNVPLNQQLQGANSESEERLWKRYMRYWTRWNHVRVGSCVISSGLFIVALLKLH